MPSPAGASPDRLSDDRGLSAQLVGGGVLSRESQSEELLRLRAVVEELAATIERQSDQIAQLTEELRRFAAESSAKQSSSEDGTSSAPLRFLSDEPNLTFETGQSDRTWPTTIPFAADAHDAPFHSPGLDLP